MHLKSQVSKHRKKRCVKKASSLKRKVRFNIEKYYGDEIEDIDLNDYIGDNEAPVFGYAPMSYNHPFRTNTIASPKKNLWGHIANPIFNKHAL